MTSSASDRLTVGSPYEIIAAVPYLLGFHPDNNSLVGVVVANDLISLTARLDLPASADEPSFAEGLGHAAALFAAQGTGVLIVGYGEPERVGPAADALVGAVTAVNLEVLGVLRVTDGRAYCLRCDGSCPREGVPVDPGTSVFAAEATYRGMAAAPDRAALEALIAPVSGPAQARMEAATAQALQRLTAMKPAAAASEDGSADGQPGRPLAELLGQGHAAVDHALQAATRGEVLSDTDAAWLAAVLQITAVRDHACQHSDGDAHRRLWIDLTRRAVPTMTAAPATLLAATAYLAGDGALAAVALDRALQAEPGYAFAVLLRHALRTGIAPAQLRQALKPADPTGQ